MMRNFEGTWSKSIHMYGRPLSGDCIEVEVLELLFFLWERRRVGRAFAGNLLFHLPPLAHVLMMMVVICCSCFVLREIASFLSKGRQPKRIC